jgi:hypothetical protein
MVTNEIVTGLVDIGAFVLSPTSIRVGGNFRCDASDCLSVDFLLATIDLTVTHVPLPAALPLFGTGLGILGFLGWRRRRKAQAA